MSTPRLYQIKTNFLEEGTVKTTKFVYITESDIIIAEFDYTISSMPGKTLDSKTTWLHTYITPMLHGQSIRKISFKTNLWVHI